MCYHCSFAITTGKRHLSEWCSPAFITDDVPADEHERQNMEYYAKIRQEISTQWKHVETEFDGVGAELLPIRTIGHLDFHAGAPSEYQKIIMKNSPISEEGLKEKEKLFKEYGKARISLMELVSVRNPWEKTVPFFRQVYLSQGCFYLANSTNNFDSGTIRISGNLAKLAEIVRRMYEKGRLKNISWKDDVKTFAANSPYTIATHADFQKLLACHGVIKFKHGYYFAVAIPAGKGRREFFSFSDSPEMLEAAVFKELKRKIEKRQMMLVLDGDKR